MVKAEGAEKDADGYIEIEPQKIDWDKDGDPFSGFATVEATTQLVNPNGNPIGEPITPNTSSWEEVGCKWVKD